MKTQIINRRKNNTEQRRLNRLRNENIKVDISAFFENEIIRNQRQISKLQNENNISNFFEHEIIRNQRKLNKLQNEISIRKKIVFAKFVILMFINLVSQSI